MASKYVLGFMLGLALISLTSGAYAGSDLDDAIKAGAKRLMADEIAERLTGKTVTFVSAKTGDKFLVFYGEANDAASKKVGGEGTNVGFYAVTDRDQVCLGWEGRDLPKLRCMDVVEIDGVLHKYKADGSLSGRIIDFADGNQV
jgi:hypothetical protein